MVFPIWPSSFRERRRRWLLALVAMLVPVGVGQAGDVSMFESKVAPLLERRCFSCHNDQRTSGGFSLQTAESAFAAGYIVPGDAENSHLLELITPQGGSARMPKDADPLSGDERQLLRTWIAEGAPWPEGRRLKEPAVTDFDWWSYQPIKRPDVPKLESDWVRTPIDAFVLERLHAGGLTPSAGADRRTLIRRLSYDLTGLPPTPEEVTSFLADASPDAYDRLVDRLLASPRYGERWARHWLDVVKYADSCGYDKDKPRPNAWPYRDYVIRSLNEDKPYSRFVQEQVAGDVLYRGEEDGVIALGFLAAGPWDFIGHVEVPESKIDGMVARNLDRDDMVSNVMNTFCSVTVQCARCHNHKFDPITQEHYYGLQAVFAAVDRAERPYGRAAKGAERPKVYAASTRFTPEGQFQPTRGRPRVVRVLDRGEVTSPGKIASPGTISLDEQDDWRFGATEDEGQRRASLARWLVSPDNPLVWRSIVNRVWQYHFGEGLAASANDFGRMGQPPTHPELLDWLAVEFRDGGGSLKSLHRLIVTSAVYRQSSGGDDAKTLMDSDNRWLWRANRRRLEAEEVRDSILSISGKMDLAMGGPGYYLFHLEKAEHSPHYEYHQFDHTDAVTYRRSIYAFVVRSQPNPWMSTLDCADSSQSTAKRDETLTSLQALALLNNRFNLVMAKHFADSLRAYSSEVKSQVERAMELVVQRSPTEQERTVMIDYAEQHGLENLCRMLLNLNEFLFVD